MPRRRIYLMRHAEMAYYTDPARRVAHEQAPMTADGAEQARAAGRALARIRFDRVLTSDLQRTIATAQLVVAQLEHPPADPDFEAWPELRELQSGDVDALADGELEDGFLAVSRGIPPAGATYAGGETVGSLTGRVASAMERLFADRGWQTILLVLHGFANRAILSWALAGRGTFFGQFEQSPSCINIIDGEPGAFVLRAVNLTAYDVLHSGPRTTTLEDYLEQYRGYRKAMQR
jgi:broad specificity phosphatase PhoE